MAQCRKATPTLGLRAHPFQRTWVSFAWAGNDAERTYNDVFLLKWNDSTKTVEQESLPGLPTTIAFTAASTLGSKVYLAGGTETNDLASAMNNFWMLDLEKVEEGWQELPGWPGPTRGLNLTIAQHNGKEDQVFVFSGRRNRRQWRNWNF